MKRRYLALELIYWDDIEWLAAGDAVHLKNLRASASMSFKQAFVTSSGFTFSPLLIFRFTRSRFA